MHDQQTGGGPPDPNHGYTVKDSGKREQFASGMQRDVTIGKARFDLVFDGPMLARYAEHLKKGAEKYSARNWMKADGIEELERFRESAARHFAQWMAGDRDEDHASAVYFNINGYEYVRDKMLASPNLDADVRRRLQAGRVYVAGEITLATRAGASFLA
jgi:hypothetical protein